MIVFFWNLSFLEKNFEILSKVFLIYFKANESSRSSQPPRRFRQPSKISKLPIITSDFSKKDQDSVNRKVSQATKILEKGATDLLNEYNQGILSLNNLDTLDYQNWQEEERKNR